jgi:GAF domain-containing protein
MMMRKAGGAMAASKKSAKSVQPRKRRTSLGRKKANGGADFKQQLAESRAQQAATAEILKVIARSPSDTQPVFDAIAKSARRLVGGFSASVTRVDGGALHLAAHTATNKAGEKALRAFYPWPISKGYIASAFRTKGPISIEDIETDKRVAPKSRRLARVRGYRSILNVPMLGGDSVVGIINVTRRDAGPFPAHQIELIKTFADQAVIAIENARRFNETKEALERQTATAEILKVIASSPSDVQPVFDAIAQSAKQLLNGGAALVARRAGDTLHLEAFTRTSEEGDTALQKQFPSRIVGKGHMGKAVLTGGPAWVSDIETDTDYSDAFRAMARARGLRSIVSVPMLREGEAIGVISVNRPIAGKFSDHQTNLLKTFADQAVIAIENVRLFNETKSALARQTATAEILRVLGGSMTDTQPVFDAIVKNCHELFKNSGVMLRLAADGHLHVKASVDYPLLGSLPIDRTSAIGTCVLEGRTIHLPDLDAAAKEFPRIQQLGLKYGFRSGIYAPLMHGGKAIGAMSVLRRDQGAFDDKDVQLFNTFADQAVIAIENVRLFNETKEALERQTATAEILRVIASSPSDVQPVFDAIVRSAKRLIGAHSSAVTRVAGGMLHLAAFSTTNEAGDETLKKNFPIPIPESGSLAEAIRTKTSSVVSDFETDTQIRPEARVIARQRGYRSMLRVPMLREGTVIGVIHATRAEPGTYSDHHVELLKTFADQAVIAIENVRLFNETKESLERQTATAEILKVIASSPSDVQPVFDAIARNSVRLSNGSGAAVFRHDGGLMHFVAHDGFEPEAFKLLKSQYPLAPRGLMGQALRERTVVHTPDMLTDPRTVNVELAKALQFRGFVAVPMLREGEPIGAIVVFRRQAAPFSSADIAVMTTFADQAVIAIENVRMFNETKEALERQTATAEILKVIASSPADVQPVFDAIAQAAKRLVSAFSVAVLRLVDGKFHLAALTSTNPAGDEALRRTFPRAASASGLRSIDAAIRTRRPHAHADIQNDPNVDEDARAAARARGFRGSLAVPMLLGGEAVGIINVTRSEAGLFSDHQIELLKTFADQAVIAIENVRLFNETKEALERQTATADILKVISSSPTDVQPVFEAIATRAALLSQAKFAYVTMFDGELLHMRATYGVGSELHRAHYPLKPGSSAISARVVRDRAPVRVEDVMLDPEYEHKDSAAAEGFRSVMGVPMMRDGRVVGTISIARPEPGNVPDQVVAVLQTFADQAVIAIQNVRLFNETKEALERQTATAEILKVIAGSSTEVQPVFDAIVRSAGRLFGRNAALRLVDADGLQRRATSVVDPEEFHGADLLPIDRNSLVGIAILEAKAMQLADTSAHEATAYARANAPRLSFRSIATAPLIRDGVAIGVITVSSPQPGALSASHMELLATFADQAVIAIENVRLFNETKEALEQQTATAGILQVISGSPTDTQPVFEAIVQSGLRLFPNAAVAVVLPEGNKMRMAAVATQLPAQAAAWRAGFGDSLSRDRMHGVAILDSRLVDMPDAETEKDGPLGPSVKNFLAGGNRAITIMPMICDEIAIGAISVIRQTPGPLSGKQLALLRTFASQAVIAIENVRLFNETKESLERQTATAEILQVISASPTDVQPVFEAIAKASVRIIGGFSAAVFRLVGDQIHLAALTSTSSSGDEALRSYFPRTLEGSMGQVVRSGTAAICTDAETELAGDTRPMALARGWRSRVIVPMIREDVTIGTISVTRREVGSFSEHNVGLLKTFADQAVIAIENVRLFNETKESLERQTATAEILKVIASSPTDVQPVFDVIVESAVRLCGARFGRVYRYDGSIIQMVAGHGLSTSGLATVQRVFPRPAADDTIVGRVILARQPFFLRDIERDGTVPELSRQMIKALDTRSQLTIPMLRAGEAIGALTLGWDAPDGFDDQRVALLQTFADQAVIAIENVRLFNETKEALERQTVTADILKVIASSPSSVQPVFDAIVQSAARLFGRRAGMRIVEGNILRRVARSHALLGGFGGADVMPINRDSLVGAVALNGRAMQVVDTHAQDAPPYVRAHAHELDFRANASVPLVRDDVVIGTIAVSSPDPGALSDKEMALLSTFADQAVIAIENVRLFKELQAQTEALTKSVGQLTALGEVGQAISSTLDLETVLQTIVARAVQLTDLDGGSVYEYDEGSGEFRLQAADNQDAELLEAIRRAPIRKGDGTVGRTAVTLEATQVSDILDAGYQSSRKELLIRAGYRAILTVPLLREDRVIGALSVTRKTPGPFAPEVVELLKTFATQSAMAIQNARLFREIAEKGKQLEEASKHKSNFLASMSHELRTPLNAILGFNEMILGQVYGEVPKDMQEPLADIQTSGKHLLRLINNVLDLAKIEAGRMELSLQDYSVHDTVASVHSTLRPLAAEKGLEFLATVPNDIPLAYGDGGRMAQCLMNLAGNSLKFTKAGKVEISAQAKGELLVYKVTDTGIGIPPDKIGSLFTEFKQTDATIASEYGGTGLGLSISRKFVEMHGGRIWVESELGKGSAFIIEIPLRVKTS